jgi:hypothetical protein
MHQKTLMLLYATEIIMKVWDMMMQINMGKSWMKHDCQKIDNKCLILIRKQFPLHNTIFQNVHCLLLLHTPFPLCHHRSETIITIQYMMSASCTMGTGSFPGVASGRGMTLTPHPLLLPRSENIVELYLYSP